MQTRRNGRMRSYTQSHDQLVVHRLARGIIAKRSGSNVVRALMRRRRFDQNEESRNRALSLLRRTGCLGSTCSCSRSCRSTRCIDRFRRAWIAFLRSTAATIAILPCPSLVLPLFYLPRVSQFDVAPLFLTYRSSIVLFLSIIFCSQILRADLPRFLFLHPSRVFLPLRRGISSSSLSAPFFFARRAQSSWPFFSGVRQIPDFLESRVLRALETFCSYARRAGQTPGTRISDAFHRDHGIELNPRSETISEKRREVVSKRLRPRILCHTLCPNWFHADCNANLSPYYLCVYVSVFPWQKPHNFHSNASGVALLASRTVDR